MSRRYFVGPDDAPDRYQLVRWISRGGEAELWEASITLAGEPERLAVKILRSDRLHEVTAWQERWADQVELLRLIRHPGVVGVHTQFEGPRMHLSGQADPADRALYLVMNWVDGQDLRDWVPLHFGPEHRSAVMRCLGQVADVLDWLHAGHATPSGRCVIHGDVTPGNVVVDQNGQAVLVDFGLVRITRHMTAFPAGTEGYCAPEVLGQGLYSPASDRYAFGGLAYYVLTGQHPPVDQAELRAGLSVVPVVGGRPELVDHMMTIFADEPDQRPLCGDWLRGLRLHTSTVMPDAARLPPLRPGRAHPAAAGVPTVPNTRPAGKARSLRRALLIAAVVLAGVAAIGLTAPTIARWAVASAASDDANHGIHESGRPLAGPTGSPSAGPARSTATPSDQGTSAGSTSRPRSLLDISPLEGTGEYQSGPQRVNVQDYQRTLYGDCYDGIHSAVWQLDRKYHTFQARVGLSDDSRSSTTVTFQVLVDGKERAGPVTGVGATKDVTVDLTNVFRLRLQTDCGFSAAGTAVWIDPVIE
ncbi:protein kinase [Dactylosporangium sp. NPDC051485]|uniref:serine/threonine protein kinase n=1 Tax=Dactylosporangium sp. NPDC051485 TaxID=3154846 RepID=UPI003447898F